MTCVSPIGLPGRSLDAGIARDERYAGKSVGEKVRTVADPCMAVFGFHPWVVGGALMPPAQAGQMTAWRAFVIRWQSGSWQSCSVRWAQAAHPSQIVAALDEVRCASAARRSTLRRSGRARLPPRGPSGPTSSAAGCAVRSGSVAHACGRSRGC
jgi:hypothetical protein